MRTQPAAPHRLEPVLRLRGPADVLAAIPYLLGFHPADSLVLVGLRDGDLVVTVRLDLAELADPGVLPDAIAAMTRGGATSLVAAIYAAPSSAAGPRGGAGAPGVANTDLPWSGAACAVAATAAAAGGAVLDILLVGEGRWWSYSCTSTQCCPAAGSPLPPSVSEVAATATYAGLVALPDRAALAAVLEPYAAEQRAALLPMLTEADDDAIRAALEGGATRHDRSLKRALFAAARKADDDVAGALGPRADAEVACLGAALRQIALRDSLWMAADDGRIDGRRLWQELARRLPAPYDAAPLFLFGWCCWRDGNGALAGIAAQRAIDSDPGYSAADLLLAALAHGVDPRRLPKLRLPRSA